MLFQRTIKETVYIEGVGLHSGEKAGVSLSPAPPGTGVVFIVDGVKIAAVHENVGNTFYATSLQKNGETVRTVEHLLAALAGLTIDNVYVHVHGGEVPIMDGSAWPFVNLLRAAGVVMQGVPRRYLKIVRPVTVNDNGKSAMLLPSPVPRITYRIEFEHTLISDQRRTLDLDTAVFEAEVARARTFGFLKDEELLRKAGLARGASLDNAVVVDEARILNEGGLRFQDEFVLHKILDAVGDLSLIGMPFIGHFVADKSGHRLNHLLVGKALAQPDCWVILEGGAAYETAPAGLTMTEAV